MQSSDRPSLLYLVHRIPFPPNKGDKIRSFHWLRHLSATYDVHLGTFVDDVEDRQYISEIEARCATTAILPLDRASAFGGGVRALLTGSSLSVGYYNSRDMQRWVRETVERFNPQIALVFSSPMAQFLGDYDGVEVVDFVDMDSDKWRQYASGKRFPMSWVYAYEARKLLAFEENLSKRAEASIFVSSRERELFLSTTSTPDEKIAAVPNGVDTAFFDPSHELANPFPEGVRPIVFTGAMDYWANVDAVRWFADEILPKVTREHPHQMFYIVGSRPSNEVLKLAGPNVVVTGAVDDIRPYILHARCAVAPMRIARGIQNKVLEALAMGRPTVVTSAGLDGLDLIPGEHLHCTDSEDQFAELVIRLIENEDFELMRAARTAVLDRYSWRQAYDTIDAVLAHAVEGSTRKG